MCVGGEVGCRVTEDVTSASSLSSSRERERDGERKRTSERVEVCGGEWVEEKALRGMGG